MNSSMLRLHPHVDHLKLVVVTQVTGPTWVFVPTLEGSSSKKSKRAILIFTPYNLLLLLLWEALGTDRKIMRLALGSI
jgi:hypothetical protein